MQVPFAIVDDDLTFAEGVRQALERSGQFSCVAICASGDEALRRLPDCQPRVILMDILMPGTAATMCVTKLTELVPHADIMMLTVVEDPERIYQSLAAGATGYLLKQTTPDELLEAVRDLINGGSPMTCAIARKVALAFRRLGPFLALENSLTQREEEILKELRAGRRPKEIAQKYGVSPNTVRTHQRNIYKKLQVSSRKEAIRHLGKHN